jgi:agmatinase
MTASPPFLGFPNRLADGRLPRAVIFGAGQGSTYPGQASSGYALAAVAIRAASQGDAGLVEHWDFDLGGPLFDGKPVCCIDAGDVPTTMHDNAGNRARIEAKAREVLALPAVPILLGGDDSVPIPFLAGFADHGPVCILQIDAHIDWRDELHGERYGYSNPMRRASEMPHVAGIVQVGIRSVGSARLTEIEAARHYGSRFVTAREVHAQGVEAALRHIPEGARAYISGQGGQNSTGALSPDFAVQVEQAYANLRTALDALGARPDQVAKLTVFVVDHDMSKLEVLTKNVKEMFGEALPAQTLIPVPKLAVDPMLFEVEAIVILE